MRARVCLPVYLSVYLWHNSFPFILVDLIKNFQFKIYIHNRVLSKSYEELGL